MDGQNWFSQKCVLATSGPLGEDADVLCECWKTNTPTNGGGDDAQIANFNIDPPSSTVAAAAAMAGGRQVAANATAVVAVVGQYLQNSAHSACARCQNSASSQIDWGAHAYDV